MLELRGLVLSLCDRTGNMVKPWLEAGYRAITIDLQESTLTHPNHTHIQGDVRQISTSILKIAAPIAAVFAFPPCTHLAVSGARWFRSKGLGLLIEGLEIVEKCRVLCKDSQAPWMLENPVGVLATYWRDPDFAFDPCDYGDPYTKKTCIWCGNGFVMPPQAAPGDMFSEPTRVEPTLGSMMHKMPPSAERGDTRSITPMGFARAVFDANAERMAEAAE
jgi:hypothetical protein